MLVPGALVKPRRLRLLSFEQAASSRKAREIANPEINDLAWNAYKGEAGTINQHTCPLDHTCLGLCLYSSLGSRQSCGRFHDLSILALKTRVTEGYLSCPTVSSDSSSLPHPAPSDCSSLSHLVSSSEDMFTRSLNSLWHYISPSNIV